MFSFPHILPSLRNGRAGSERCIRGLVFATLVGGKSGFSTRACLKFQLQGADIGDPQNPRTMWLVKVAESVNSFWEDSWVFIAFHVSHEKDHATDSTACYDLSIYILLLEIFMCSLVNQPFFEASPQSLGRYHLLEKHATPCLVGIILGVFASPKWPWFHVPFIIAEDTELPLQWRGTGEREPYQTASMDVIVSHGPPSLANRDRELSLLIKTCISHPHDFI